MLATDRRYRVLEVLGRGGFGSVYKARFSGGDGFEKLVAIKLLSEAANTSEVLERFRDEARILGLLRDRAVIQVDAPVRLGGRWAVVMEYADGASLSRVLHLHRRIPARVMVELVAEVARALAKAQVLPGPDGRPLRLIHRDLKPGNLQLTSSGEVKILDFGNSRADFDQREAATTTAITGTPGYIAPERFDGIEDPRGDVFSLGTVLYRGVVGAMPGEALDGALDADPDVAPVLDLVQELRKPLAERVDARELERRASALVDRLAGPRLRTWAEENVPAHSRAADDDLVGTELSETFSGTADLRPPPPPPEPVAEPVRVWPRGLALVLAAAALAMTCSGALGTLALYGGWQASTPTLTEAVVTDGQDPSGPAPGSPPSSDTTTGSPTSGERVPSEATPLPRPTPAPPPSPAPPSRPKPAAPVVPVPAPVPAPPPEPAPVSAVAPIAVTLSSIPFGLAVTVDGVPAGKTPVKRDLLPGTHTVSIRAGDQVQERTIEVGPHGARRWVLQEGKWQPYY